MQALELVAVVMKNKLASLGFSWQERQVRSQSLERKRRARSMRQMAVNGTRSGCARNVANVSRHVRHASAISVFMVGIEREDWLRARNVQFVGLSSICGSDCGDTCVMSHAAACKQRVRERCRCSKRKMLTALTKPKRSRGKSVRGQGLAGCGVRLVNVPNDVWILHALMTAMSSALPSAPMPARTVVQ